MLFWLSLACNKESGFSDSYAITVTATDVTDDGIVTTCTDDTTGYRDSFIYEVHYFGSTIEIDINGKSFATGKRNGCQYEYSTNAYLESNNQGDFTWQIEGVADVENVDGGCASLPEKTSWYGSEIITVLASDNEDVDIGCSYETQVVGNLDADETECCMICPAELKACGDICIDEDEDCLEGTGCACDYY